MFKINVRNISPNESPYLEYLANAITEPFVVDSRLCIAYHNIENRDLALPSKIKNSLGSWIAGCDICQDVCPWNEKFSEISDISAFQPRKEILEWTNEDWQKLDSEGFRKLFKGSAVKRTKFVGLKRNINQNT